MFMFLRAFAYLVFGTSEIDLSQPKKFLVCYEHARMNGEVISTILQVKPEIKDHPEGQTLVRFSIYDFYNPKTC